ncbi:MAG TPA: EamA family transporter [Chitinophagaceae bacterium]|nr:EamA family transporter [Chitinophagaceae bacterium]MCC6634630.1 EamA family transporter [Chitinophagaceae bacterium]HMZ46091.1 EamA family transporter [Chitinophagaceae bacterium]HNE93184.1 EamA family transporter [Chitinophagaceae bacterium]HNF30161.1 EamA family transporter [Chitinophagaceae bacterium]
MTNKQKAYLALAVTSIVWGTTWVAVKFGVQKMPALQLAAIRLFFAGLAFILFFTLVRKQSLPTKKQLQQLFFLSVFTFVLANALSAWSLQYIGSGLGALIGALYPLCVVIIEYFFYKNKSLNTTTLIGILLGFIGVGIVLYENTIDIHQEGFLIGILLSAIATIAWSYSTIMIAKQKVKINPYYGLGWQMLFGSIMVLVLSLVTHNFIPISQIPIIAWLMIAYLFIAGSIVAFIAFIYSMKHLSPTIASLYAYMNPIVAISIGTVLLDEKISIKLIIGAIISLIGVYLVNYAAKKAMLKIDMD